MTLANTFNILNYKLKEDENKSKIKVRNQNYKHEVI